MNKDTNALNWFEIPVMDMARAKHFYQVIFSIHMETQEMMGMQMAYFPVDPSNGKVSGALVKSESHVPVMQGVTVYLNGNPDLSAILEKVESENGKILMPKTMIDEQTGHMAFFADTEGNRVGLHSRG
ncbi:MAG TPA: VOC family protein [Puia sp.]|jgi:predicted enzyme related to lactoylglutathione lyase|nr:VOC family protein [Puia sp.]